MEPAAPIDPRAVRVTVAPTSRMDGDPTITVGPAPVPIEPLREQLAGVGMLGGMPNGYPSSAAGVPDAAPAGADSLEDASRWPLVDGRPVPVRLEWVDGQRVVLWSDDGSGPVRKAVQLGPVRARASDGTLVREAVVDGWRIDIELESERRAALRERARRGKEAAGHSGPLEIHAIIPGRIVAVSVAPGDAVTAGQQILVLEAMKMQNELRAPREGTIERVAVAVGVNVEVGDLLMVIS
jgi:biotin carboxyl carrier protein